MAVNFEDAKRAFGVPPERVMADMSDLIEYVRRRGTFGRSTHRSDAYVRRRGTFGNMSARLVPLPDAYRGLLDAYRELFFAEGMHIWWHDRTPPYFIVRPINDHAMWTLEAFVSDTYLLVHTSTGRGWELWPVGPPVPVVF